MIQLQDPNQRSAMLDAHRAEASPAFLQSSQPGFGDNAFASHVMNRPRGTLARCPEMNDAWARNGKPDRFKRDVRVIHPAKAHQGRRRQHSEANSHPRVPASSRAPDFVRQADDPGQALVERRLVAEPPMRLGGRVGGEGSVGVQAARWNRRPGTVCRCHGVPHAREIVHGAQDVCTAWPRVICVW